MQPNNYHYFYNVERTVFDEMSFNRLRSYGIKEYVIAENISCFFELFSFLMVISQILQVVVCCYLNSTFIIKLSKLRQSRFLRYMAVGGCRHNQH